MPELPDVETYKRYIDATSLHRQIAKVKLRTRRILTGVSPNKLRATLHGHRFQSTTRHGKYLFVKTDNAHWLMLHFGMTGSLRYFKSTETVGRHDRLIISFDNSYTLAFVCSRLFGKVTLTTSVEEFITNRRLGPDALDIAFEDFHKILQKSKATAKATVMNQKRIAGIGNIYSDEILFLSGLHPKARSDGLSLQQTRKIHRNMIRVLNKAIERHADPRKLPLSYLSPHRQKGGTCPRCRNAIQIGKVCGRTSYFCPYCQSRNT